MAPLAPAAFAAKNAIYFWSDPSNHHKAGFEYIQSLSNHMNTSRSESEYLLFYGAFGAGRVSGQIITFKFSTPP